MAMSLQDLLAAIYRREGVSPTGGKLPGGDARLGPREMNPKPRPPKKPPQLRPMPWSPDSRPSQAIPLPSRRTPAQPMPFDPRDPRGFQQTMPFNPNEDSPTMVPLGGGIQSRSFRMNPNMQAIIEAAAQGRQRGNAPQARAQRFMRSDPSQMLGMVQR